MGETGLRPRSDHNHDRPYNEGAEGAPDSNRSRRASPARREEPVADELAGATALSDPEYEVLLADSVGTALAAVLDALSPSEQIAFALHHAFAVPFDEIAFVLGRSPAAAKQLAHSTR